MNILVTGAAGFIGTHVIKKLRERVPDATIWECDAFEPRVHKNRPNRSIRFPFKTGGITFEMLHDVDVIIHLAAQVGVADSWDDPNRYLEDNTFDTSAFLEQVRLMMPRPKKLVVASSMSVYGDPRTSDPVSEDHPVRPASIYGLTKFDQETLSMIYGETLGISTTALRFFNVYGPGQALHNPYTGVLAIFANAILNGRSPTIYEDGLQTRDFVYVEDVADAVVHAALTPEMKGVYNVCTGFAMTIYGVATRLARALGRPYIAPHVTREKRPGDIRHCVGDPEKLRNTMEWAPKHFGSGVEAYASALLRNRVAT